MDQSVFSFSKKYNYLSILFRRGRKFIEGVGGGGGGYPRLPRKFSHHDSTVGFFKENEFSCIYTAASWKYLMVAIFCLGISSHRYIFFAKKVFFKFDLEAILKMFIVFI